MNLKLKFLKLIYNKAVCRLFLTLPSKQLKLKIPSIEKLKLKHLDVLILWNSKNIWFCVCEDKSYIAVTIMVKYVNIFC